MDINRVLKTVADVVYPRICPVCNGIVSRFGADICPECVRKLTPVEAPSCGKCGKPVDAGGLCEDCGRIAHVYDRGCAALVYDEYISKSIYRFKYNGKREFSAFYGRIMAERCGDAIRSWKPDAIVPVPVHKSKLQKRGYNQAELIARELSGRLKIPVDTALVERRAATKVQKELGAGARQKNLKGAFKVTQNAVKLKTVLIVDDIYTTGATVDAVAGCLKGAGVGRVYYASLCIGRGN
ncbi:MAG: ComF family protein [Lachnospiraceae bacterium]|nr:ComF family protein [Lachnospiraceae bacterium]